MLSMIAALVFDVAADRRAEGKLLQAAALLAASRSLRVGDPEA